MESYQEKFIDFSIECEVLRFGQFTLKSGRRSPYFFNTGLFNTGVKMKKLGEFYAAAVIAQNLRCDGIFGPAYKGIPLGTSIAIALAADHGLDLPISFNRKEEKDHGEGGSILGAALVGEILIVDDVISAGTSVRESLDLIRDAGATPASVLIALDRQERGVGAQSAISELKQNHGLAVNSIVTLFNIIQFLEKKGNFEQEIAAIREYHHEFGA